MDSPKACLPLNFVDLEVLVKSCPYFFISLVAKCHIPKCRLKSFQFCSVKMKLNTRAIPPRPHRPKHVSVPGDRDTVTGEFNWARSRIQKEKVSNEKASKLPDEWWLWLVVSSTMLLTCYAPHNCLWLVRILIHCGHNNLLRTLLGAVTCTCTHRLHYRKPQR